MTKKITKGKYKAIRAHLVSYLLGIVSCYAICHYFELMQVEKKTNDHVAVMSSMMSLYDCCQKYEKLETEDFLHNNNDANQSSQMNKPTASCGEYSPKEKLN